MISFFTNNYKLNYLSVGIYYYNYNNMVTVVRWMKLNRLFFFNTSRIVSERYAHVYFFCFFFVKFCIHNFSNILLYRDIKKFKKNVLFQKVALMDFTIFFEPLSLPY